MSAPVGVHYGLSLADIPGRRFAVSLRVEGGLDQGLTLRLPAWIPGSYLIREYAGHLAPLTAEADGVPLAVTKHDKATWRVTPTEAAAVVVRYTVFAPELSVRTNDISHDHAFVNPAGTFLMVEGREHEPSDLQFDLPEGWHVATSLRRPDPSGPWEVPDYDTLVDSPMELGPHPVHRFQAAGVPHELVIHGEGNLDLDRALEDMRKIVECEAAMFGGLPLDRYLFILLLTPSGGGGLEHLHSSVLAWPKLRFRPEKEYRRFLTLVAHEYFHLWNVKRIKPEVLLSVDYSREVYTRLLWVFEGITSYYDELIPVRAGAYAPKHYLEFLADHIVSERAKPGRDLMSLEDSSFDTWIKLYRPTPDSYNTQVSYYERGELAGLVLDLHLRTASGGRASLDDVMRHLYALTHGEDRGLPEDGFAAVVQEATGVDCAAFLERLTRGTGDLGLDDALATVGLRLREKDRDDDDRGAWMGAAIDTEAGVSRLGHVTTGGPANRAGLMSGDEVVALDGHRVRADLADRLKLYAPGEEVRWTVFRRDRQVEGSLRFDTNPNPPLRVVPVETPSEAQRQAFAAWTGVAWEVAFDDDSTQAATRVTV